MADVIEEAAEKGWCTDRWCTTCGASGLRSAYLARAIRGVGLDPPRDALDHRALFDSIPKELMESVYNEIADALAELDQDLASTSAALLIASDNEFPVIRWGVGEALSDRVRGTPIGEVLENERAAEAAYAKDRANRRAELIAEKELREREKAEASVQMLRARNAAKAEHDATRAALVERLSRFTLLKRLRWLAEQQPGFPLEMLPTDLFSDHVGEKDVSREEAAALLSLIGNRRGLWGRLARQLRSLYG